MGSGESFLRPTGGLETIKEKVEISYIEITLLSSKNKNESPNTHEQKRMSKI